MLSVVTDSVLWTCELFYIETLTARYNDMNTDPGSQYMFGVVILNLVIKNWFLTNWHKYSYTLYFINLLAKRTPPPLIQEEVPPIFMWRQFVFARNTLCCLMCIGGYFTLAFAICLISHKLLIQLCPIWYGC